MECADQGGEAASDLDPLTLLTPVQEQLTYLDTTTDSGSKRLDFRFAH